MRQIRGLRYVQRFNFHNVNRMQNVAEHSFFVAYYALIAGNLVPDLDTGQLVTFALLHDAEESLTGDIPHLVKKKIRYQMTEIEYRARIELKIQGIKFNSTSKDIRYQQIVDFLDLWELKIYLEEERLSGNMHLMEIEEEICEQVQEHICPVEVKRYFINHMEVVKAKRTPDILSHEGRQFDGRKSQDND